MISCGTARRMRWSSSSLRVICWSLSACSSSASLLIPCCLRKSSIRLPRIRSMSKTVVARSSRSASVMMLASRTSRAWRISWSVAVPCDSCTTCACSAFWRSSNSLAVMIRSLTLATISSTTAARDAGARSPAAIAATSQSATAGRVLVAVLAEVAEGEDGAIDMDLGLASQVREVALHHLVRLLPEQGRLDTGADLLEVRLRLLLLHQLEDGETRRHRNHRADLARLERADRGAHLRGQVLGGVGPRLPAVGRHRFLLCRRLELPRVDHEGPSRLVRGALIFQHDLAQDKSLAPRPGLGVAVHLVLDLPRADMDRLQDGGVLDLLEGQGVADLGAESLLAVGGADVEVPFREAQLLEVGVHLGLGDRDLEALGFAHEDLLLDELVEEAAVDGIGRLPLVGLLAGVVVEVALEGAIRERLAGDGGHGARVALLADGAGARAARLGRPAAGGRRGAGIGRSAPHRGDALPPLLA